MAIDDQRVDAQRPARGVERRPDDEPLVVGDPRRLEPAAVAGQPLPGDEQRPRPGEERDLAVAQLDERPLRDIGLDRGAARFEASKSFWS